MINNNWDYDSAILTDEETRQQAYAMLFAYDNEGFASAETNEDEEE